jgi:hypothetical protein
MESRLGLIVTTVASLREKLSRWLSGEEEIADLHHGEVKRERGTLSVFAADEDLAAAIDAWVAKGKYAKLLELWVKGLSVDWKRLYGERRPRRVRLPTYPFARKRFWLEGAQRSIAADNLADAIPKGDSKPSRNEVNSNQGKNNGGLKTLIKLRSPQDGGETTTLRTKLPIVLKPLAHPQRREPSAQAPAQAGQ